jgi:hypothetical protein
VLHDWDRRQLHYNASLAALLDVMLHRLLLQVVLEC